jgi:hypothetical protein
VMTHLKRAGAILAIVLAFVFVGLRVMPVPENLAGFGFHQQDEEANRVEWASQPIQFVSSSLCVDCHQENYVMWEKGNHRTVSCENCHGPAKQHLDTGELPRKNSERELCELCHAQLISRPSNFPQVDMAEMGHGEKCVTCHNPHEPRAGMPPQVPHSLDGRSECQSCHGPHEPWIEPPPEVPHTMEGRTECLSCHGPAELRGLALPHIPHSLEGRDNCLECHNASAIKPFPADHVGRKSVSCQTCHQAGEIDSSTTVVVLPVPAPKPAPTPAPAPTQVTTPEPDTGVPAAVPHSLEGRDDCLMCHSGGSLAVPDDHSGRTSDTCTSCHSHE